MTESSKSKIGRIKLFLQLFRFPNLLIIVGTQILIRFCLLQPFVYGDDPAAISAIYDFLILVVMTVMLITAGYVINDYFDAKIDAVNRPDKIVMNRVISPHGAMKLHIALNSVAIALGFYLAWRIRAFSFGFIFPLTTGLIWIYSAKYKRVLIWGNVMASLFSAFIILIVWLFEFFWLRLNTNLFVSVLPDLNWVNKLVAGYAVFAILLTLIIEIVKDIEDADGDRLFGFRTLPVVAGIRTSKTIAALIMVAALALLVYWQWILQRLGLNLTMWYFLIAIEIPSLNFLYLLYTAKTKADYHFLGNLCRLIIVAGILSMEILYIN